MRAGTYHLSLSFICLLCDTLQDFCPCENQCTNQMFTRKQYAKVAVVSSHCCDVWAGSLEPATTAEACAMTLAAAALAKLGVVEVGAQLAAGVSVM